MLWYAIRVSVLYSARKTFPVQATDPLPRKGRVYSNPGGPVSNPPPIVIGPVFVPRHDPARIRITQPPRGRIAGNSGAPVRNPSTGPQFRQATDPIRAQILQTWSKGRAYSNPGAPVQNPPSQGPRFVPLNHPVQARTPLPMRGRVYFDNGAPLVTRGPVFHGIVQPVRARQPLPARGRVYSNPGTPVVPPAVVTRFISKSYPSRIHPSLPIRGRTYSNKGAPVHNPTRGPRFIPAVRPIRGIIPQNAPRGRNGSNPGGPVANIPSATLKFKTGNPYFRWSTGNPYFQWNTGNPET